MASNKKYWKSVEELNENSSIVKSLQQNEFVEEIPVDDFLGDKVTLENSSTTRRDFLKYVGFSTAAASLVACEGYTGAEKITIRQLLTHTSGMGNIFTEAFLMSDKGNYRELASYKQLIAETPLLFSPGTSNRYSNSGMHMLGLVIEKVSGQDYYDYIEQHVYQKANMPNSNSYELDGITSNLAIGYLKKAHSDTWVNNHYTNGVKGGPGGGGYSTIGDLHNFSQALTQFTLLSREMTEQAYSSKTEFNSPVWYGYGFIVSGEAGNRVVGHGGATLGVDARLDIHLDTGIVVVVLANQNGVVAPVLRKINSLIAQLPQEAD